MGYQFNLDRLGWAYCGIAIGWTLLLAAAYAYIWKHRHLPSIRMRRIPLLFVSVICLHIYAILDVLAYPVGVVFTCTVEFWVMSIFVPLGWGLFQASNTQFLHLASRQKQFAHLSSLKDHKSIDEEKARVVSNSRWKRIVAGVERADNIDRTLVCIGIGMGVQMALTLFVYFGSEKFHPGYGLFNYTVQGTGMEVRRDCSKGWEWWLSIVWQLFWSWIYAPYILWKSRGIRDVHGWRIQTIGVCIAGLPASPLWLTALYAPQFAPVNKYIPPPLWFSIFIFFIQIFAIGMPIIDIVRSNTLRQETLDAIANWEKRQAASHVEGLGADGSLHSPSAISATTTLKSSGDASLGKRSFDSQKSDMLTMTALENALRTNANPLLEFAALKDFSGENVSFLTHVADWRRYWFSPKSSTADHRRKQFVAATRIYAHFISLEFSEFPINISSKEMKRLHQVFEAAARIICNKRASISSANTDNATPFDNVQPEDPPMDSKSSYSSTTELQSHVNLDALGRANLRAVSQMQDMYLEEALAEFVIPDAFAEMIFDPAEREIKYLILTNTWPKFVNVGRANSQISKVADEEKGIWKTKILCSK